MHRLVLTDKRKHRQIFVIQLPSPFIRSNRNPALAPVTRKVITLKTFERIIIIIFYCRMSGIGCQ